MRGPTPVDGVHSRTVDSTRWSGGEARWRPLPDSGLPQPDHDDRDPPVVGVVALAHPLPLPEVAGELHQARDRAVGVAFADVVEHQQHRRMRHLPVLVLGNGPAGAPHRPLLPVGVLHPPAEEPGVLLWWRRFSWSKTHLPGASPCCQPNRRAPATGWKELTGCLVSGVPSALWSRAAAQPNASWPSADRLRLRKARASEGWAAGPRSSVRYLSGLRHQRVIMTLPLSK